MLPAWEIGITPDASLVNEMLDNAGLRRSMSKKGCSLDNSVCQGILGVSRMRCFTIEAGSV